MNITALTVSRQPTGIRFPGLQHRCLHGRHFRSAADVQRAWFDAIALVDTEHFFFIDDDDYLPPNYPEVLERCVAAGAAIAYTDEEVNGARRDRAPYSQDAHLQNPLLVHHLVLCSTEAARQVVADLPLGHFWPEMLLYWRMAQRGRAVHVPEIGYLWNKRPSGLHRQWFTVLGMENSRAWCAQNRCGSGKP